MMFKKIMSFFLILSICQTQIFAYTQSAEYVVKFSQVKNNISSIYKEKGYLTEDDFRSALPSMIDEINNLLFSSSSVNEVALEIVNKTINEAVEEKKKTEFIPKNSNTLMNQNNSAFGKAYELGYNDDDGIYVGFLENHLSAVSRGYYAKKYSEYNKEDGIKKDYIVLGKANFLDDLSTSLYDYKINSKQKLIQPLLLSYFNYTDTYSNFKAPETYQENKFGWNGLLKVYGEEQKDIKSKLSSFSSPLSGMEGRNFSTLVNGSNSIFLEDGKVFHYKTKEFNEELFTHISMANTFMANNNLKRGFLMAPTNNINNYNISSHKRCSGKIRKRCYYWQELKYKGGLDVYTMSFLDETYMDDWSQISYLNRNIITGPVVVPTMIPINSYAKLPSINSENYGLLYSTNYAGSIGGQGMYSFPLFSLDGLNGTSRNVKSDEYKVSGWSMLAVVLFTVVGMVAFSMVGAVAGVIVYQNLLKSKSMNSSAEAMNDIENREVTKLANSILIQTDSVEKAQELLDSSVLYGLMSNSNNYDLNKNFMSNTFHNLATKYAKNDLSQVSSYFFETNIPILKQLDNGSKYWKSSHKNGIISGYRDGFSNDGRGIVGGSEYGSFYNMKVMFRDITRQYIGY